MSKKFKIRRTNDIGLIKKLHKQTFPEDHFYNSKKNNYWLVYDENNKPVGFCMLSEWSHGIGFLSRAGLLECAQGNGLHKRMIRVRERKAKSLGIDVIITYTKIDNITSSRNLQKAGYLLYIPEYEYADEDCLYWMKELK